MILQKLKITDQPPPGWFRFTCPETGYKISGEHTIQGWYGRIERHYKDNNIPLPENWKELAEDQLCKQLPSGCCYFTDGGDAPGITPVLSFEKILQGVKSIANMAKTALKGEDVFVSQEEAEQRANICTRCYYNMNANFCMGCGGARVIIDIVGEVKGSRTTTVDYALQNCGVCGCRNDAIVHIKKNLLLSGESEDTTKSRPDWCWLKNDDLVEASNKLKL
jgi:hypothetical protein